eukprot:11221956-Lingulodinium_polyedra.AAC.1
MVCGRARAGQRSLPAPAAARKFSNRGGPRPADGTTGQITRGNQSDGLALPTHAAWEAKGTPITTERRGQTPLTRDSRRAA